MDHVASESCDKWTILSRNQTVSWGHVIVFFDRHGTTMDIAEQKQMVPIPTGKREPIASSVCVLGNVGWSAVCD